MSTDAIKSTDDGFIRNCINGGAIPGRNVGRDQGPEEVADEPLERGSVVGIDGGVGMEGEAIDERAAAARRGGSRRGLGKRHRQLYGLGLGVAVSFDVGMSADDDLGPWTDFAWGRINGKLSALRWVLGDEWDFLDT